MSKGGAVLSEFVREAVREKAVRELSALNQRSEAFASVERARDALYSVTSELSSSATTITAAVTETAASAKVKKLRKLVEDAHSLAIEIADALGVDSQRDAVAMARQAIQDALKTAGIDLSAVAPPPEAPREVVAERTATAS